VWLLSGIHHRHLQELYGCCLAPGKLYLVFASPEQGSLWALLRRTQRPSPGPGASGLRSLLPWGWTTSMLSCTLRWCTEM